MNGASETALVCYCFVALIFMLGGLVYILKPTFMPYHRQSVRTDWTALDARMQALLLAFMRATGGGFFAAGLSIMILLLVPFRAGEVWPKYAIPVIILVPTLAILRATLLLRSRTRAATPVWVGIVGMAMLIIGFVLSFL